MSKQNNPFKDFYENELPAATKEGFISLVCQTCDISYNHFYKWLNNPSLIKLPAKKQIAQIAGKKVSELFIVKTNLEAWFFSLAPSKQVLIKDAIKNKLNISNTVFSNHIHGRSKNPHFEIAISDLSKININDLYLPSEVNP